MNRHRWIERRGLGLVWLVVAGLTAGCATNPATGKRQLMLVSEGQEVALGQQADKDVVGAYGVYDDAGLQRYIQELGSRLAANSERPELPWSFRVVDDPIVNAFALPGGFIYITRGIMVHLGSEAELVGVLGHEIGHVTARHGASQMSKAQLATLGLGLGVALKPELEGVGELAGTGLGLLFLRFGRDDERQADDLGLRYLVRTAYDPHEMPKVFDTLERVSQAHGGGRLPSWLSTHPDPGERRDRMTQAIAEIDGGASGTVNRESYLRRLDGMVYGDDPRQGFFEETNFYHPELRFQLQFPREWATSNRRDAVEAVSPQKNALVRLTLATDTTAAAAADAFLSQGVQDVGRRNMQINGLRSVVLDFEAQSEGGPVAGRAAFVESDGRVYQIFGFAAVEAWATNRAVIGSALTSFGRLTDPNRLGVQPARIDLIQVGRNMSLADFSDRFPSSIPLEEVALLNQMDVGGEVHRGQLVKRVVGGAGR